MYSTTASAKVVVTSSVVFGGVDAASWSFAGDAIFAEAMVGAIGEIESADQVTNIVASDGDSSRRRRRLLASSAHVAFDVSLTVTAEKRRAFSKLR